MTDSNLTTSSVIAEVDAVLQKSNYAVKDTADIREITVEQAVLAEDEFGIVFVIVTDTAQDIANHWADYQAQLVDYLNTKLTKLDPKIWEAYMVLLTPSITPRDLFSQLERIRLDTSRIRKLVVTGEQLNALSDVSRALLPVLPLQDIDAARPEISLLESLPGIFAQRGIDEEAVRVVVSAFRSQDSPMQALHQHLFPNAPE